MKTAAAVTTALPSWLTLRRSGGGNTGRSGASLRRCLRWGRWDSNARRSRRLLCSRARARSARVRKWSGYG